MSRPLPLPGARMPRRLPALAPLLGLAVACNPPPDAADLAQTRGGNVDVYFNDPGTNAQNMWRPDVLDVMVEMIDGSTHKIDFAVMGFSHPDIVEAFERAYDRGIELRMVGDAGHLYNSGYELFRDRQIPIVTGNLNHIMHDKFMVVDDRFVFGGTANWTPTDMEHNSNNWFVLDSPPAAADFTAEFEQMFGGAFGHTKVAIDNGRSYTIGDTEVEVWFSPNEDGLGRLLEAVNAAEESVRFTIFAFTKDQVGSALIEKQAQFIERDAADGVDRDDDFRTQRSVSGVIDQSQLHSNGQYHEAYRLLAAGIPMRMDGNDNSRQPGDYQAGGGRLHSKTMIIDVYGEEPVVVTGSFNWSSSATVSNDEYMLIMRGERVAKEFDDYFERLWAGARHIGEDRLSDGDLSPGDVVINEVMWRGDWMQGQGEAGDFEGNDEYIELHNTTDRDIRLDMWQISKGPVRDDGGMDAEGDIVVGIPPGSILPANGQFLIVDHTLEPYTDGAPQDGTSAYSYGDLVVNTYNDNRQARLYLNNQTMELTLRDPEGVVVDQAGDGGLPFAGGAIADSYESGGSITHLSTSIISMERRSTPGDGRDPASWYSYSLDEGTGFIYPERRDVVLGSPGVENSPEP